MLKINKNVLEKVKKNVLMVFLASMMTVMMAACGSSSPKTDDTNVSDTTSVEENNDSKTGELTEEKEKETDETKENADKVTETPAEEETKSEERTIVGAWKQLMEFVDAPSDPGSYNIYRFNEDGTSAYEIYVGDELVMTYPGTYTVDGDALSIKEEYQTFDVTYTINGDTLTVNDNEDIGGDYTYVE